jgi:hypothetical protein
MVVRVGIVHGGRTNVHGGVQEMAGFGSAQIVGLIYTMPPPPPPPPPVGLEPEPPDGTMEVGDGLDQPTVGYGTAAAVPTGVGQAPTDVNVSEPVTHSDISLEKLPLNATTQNS